MSDETNAGSRAELIILLDRKLEEILGCPMGWGGIEAAVRTAAP